MDKTFLRQELMAKRNSLDIEEKTAWDLDISTKLLEVSQPYKVIAIYHSFRNEVNTHSIIKILLEEGKTVVCPMITNQSMNFHIIHSLDDLKEGHFGVMEPIGLSQIDANEIEMVVVPMLGFNLNKYRVGYGKGYYDQFLTKHHYYKVGIAYDFQKIDKNFEEKHDIACDIIITEKRIYE